MGGNNRRRAPAAATEGFLAEWGVSRLYRTINWLGNGE